MKKSEFTQLTQIIECLVAKEIKKQLPRVLAEAVKNVIDNNRPSIVEQTQKDYVGELVEQPIENDQSEFKTSLRELFAGTSVMSRPTPATNTPRQFAKDPVLNQILNETVSDLRHREGMVGMAAMQGGYNLNASMAPVMMEEAANASEPSFMRNAPSMPISRPPVLHEGQESNHAPMAAVLSEGVSVLDIAKQVPLAAPVAQALTKNYSAMMKLIDKKRGKL